MTFSYILGVPASADNPSDDQPDMLTNASSIFSIIGTDHVGFNQANSGQHIQMHLNATPNYIAPPAAPVGNDSIVYSNAGTASSTAQLFFKNSLATVQLSPIRAWAFCPVGVVNPPQSVNVTSVVKNVPNGSFSITLTANAVTSVNFAVLVSCGLLTGLPMVVNYTITGIGTFDLNFFSFNVATNPNSTFSFQVMQL